MLKNHSVDKDTLRIFMQTAWLSKRQFLMSLLFPLGGMFLYVLLPLLIGKLIAALANPETQGVAYLPELIVVSIFGLIFNRIGFANFLAHQAITQSILEQKALEVLLKRSVGFHNNTVGGKLVTEASDFSKAYNQVAGAVFANTLPFATILIVGSAVVFSQSIWLGLIVTAMSIFAFGAGFYDSRRRAPLRAKRLAATKKVVSHMADTIVNMQTVKTFATEDHEQSKHVVLSERLRDLRVGDWTELAKNGNNRIATLLIFQILFVVCLSSLIKNDPGLLSVGIFSLSFTATIFNRLFETFTIFRTVEEGLLQSSPVTTYLLDEVEIVDVPEAKKLNIARAAISFDQVAFAYHDRSKEESVFKRLDLNIAPGERVGLVGPSGGGKSTLTRLLLRFDNIDGGVISIDGQDISKVTQSSLRRAISYVPQEPLLFHRSVKENIAYGKPTASDDEVVATAQKAYAHEFIASLSDGYDTIVGERGVKLSGGQRQRIAIARAILKNAPILVLDEATSALDSESEVEIQKALWELMKSRTALVIAHRLSTIQKMDRIIVLDDGKIAEQGTHAELIKQKGLYAKLWAHQSGGFIEE